MDNGVLTDYIVSADECPAASGKYIQRMKLCYGADGDATMVGADANGLDVDVVRLPTAADSIADNAAFTDGTSKVLPVGYIFDEAAGTALTENDVAASRIDAKRAQVGVVEDATTRGQRAAVSAAGRLSVDASGVAVPVTDNAGSLTVDQATAASLNALVAQGAPAAQANAWFARPRKIATYRAVFRAATRPYRLTNAFGAAGRKQYATIHHASSATKTVRIRRVQGLVTLTTAATPISMDLVRITTAPATGNPAVTPSLNDSSDSAAEATCLALPTTAATESAAIAGHVMYDMGITGAVPTTNPPPVELWQDIYVAADGDDESKLPTIRAGVLEGWAVTFDCGVAATVNGLVNIEFTEE